MGHIFISYSHKDKAYAHKLQRYLLEKGFEAWLDDRIDFGAHWAHEIEKRLRECDAFILVMSSNSHESEWVQNELMLARELKKRIFPLLLEGEAWWHARTTQYVNVQGGKLPPASFLLSLAEALPRGVGCEMPIQEEKNGADGMPSVNVCGDVSGSVIIGGEIKPVKSDQGASAQVLKKGYSISVSHPKQLSKRFETTFLLQIFLSKEYDKVMAGIKNQFSDHEPVEHVRESGLKSGNLIKINFFHPDIEFSDPAPKIIDAPLKRIVLLGKPKDSCEPGEHQILVSISDVGAKQEQELESFTITVKVVDFAFGKVSRPLLSRVSAVILGLGSFIIFVLALLEQIDKTVGLTSGTAAGVLMLAISTNFYNLYQRSRLKTIP